MEKQQWNSLRVLMARAIRKVGPTPRSRYADLLILSMYIWSVANDRPMYWACQREHYGGCFRPRKLPSVSQFCRRVGAERFQRMLQAIHDMLTSDSCLAQLNFIDGKPLAVGNYTRDPDARNGWGAGRVERGYKLHALVTEGRKIASWSVEPMSSHEMNVARAIVACLPVVPCGAVVMADGNYDSHVLHKEVHRRGGWLWLKPRGMARHAVTLRQMGAARRALLRIWEQAPDVSERINQARVHIEGTFSNLTSYGGGLGPLPAFVRRLGRVRRWVGTKIVLYHIRLQTRKAAAIAN